MALHNRRMGFKIRIDLPPIDPPRLHRVDSGTIVLSDNQMAGLKGFRAATKRYYDSLAQVVHENNKRHWYRDGAKKYSCPRCARPSNYLGHPMFQLHLKQCLTIWDEQKLSAGQFLWATEILRGMIQDGGSEKRPLPKDGEIEAEADLDYFLPFWYD